MIYKSSHRQNKPIPAKGQDLSHPTTLHVFSDGSWHQWQQTERITIWGLVSILLSECLNCSWDSLISIWRILPVVRQILPRLWTCRAQNSALPLWCTHHTTWLMTTTRALQHFEVTPLADHSHKRLVAILKQSSIMYSLLNQVEAYLSLNQTCVVC
jgi:hypothetical protein